MIFTDQITAGFDAIRQTAPHTARIQTLETAMRTAIHQLDTLPHPVARTIRNNLHAALYPELGEQAVTR